METACARQGEEKPQPITSPWNLLEGDDSHELTDTTWLFENFPADQQHTLRLLSNATTPARTIHFPLPLSSGHHLSYLTSVHILLPSSKPGTESIEDAQTYYEPLENYYFMDRNGHLVNEIIFITIDSRVNNCTGKRNLKLLSPRFSLLPWRHRKIQLRKSRPKHPLAFSAFPHAYRLLKYSKMEEVPPISANLRILYS